MKIKHSIARSMRGISHSKSGLPNQDSLLLKTNGCHQLVAAVADGHGSSNCFRSDSGSRFATEIFASIANDLPVFTSYHEAKTYAESLPVKLVNEWKKRVDNDLVISPYANHEINESNADNPYLPYGCTFLGCYISSKYAICLQIGDGEMFALYSNGETKYLVPGDDRLNGNATTSLCLPDAEKDFRISVIDLEGEILPEIIILATDGLGQSYANDSELLKWGVDLKDIYNAKSGVETLETNLAVWLDDISFGASADDISMVAFWLEKEESNLHPDKLNTARDENAKSTLLKEEKKRKGPFWFFRNKKNKIFDINN